MSLKAKNRIDLLSRFLILLVVMASPARSSLPTTSARSSSSRRPLPF